MALSIVLATPGKYVLRMDLGASMHTPHCQLTYCIIACCTTAEGSGVLLLLCIQCVGKRNTSATRTQLFHAEEYVLVVDVATQFCIAIDVKTSISEAASLCVIRDTLS